MRSVTIAALLLSGTAWPAPPAASAWAAEPPEELEREQARWSKAVVLAQGRLASGKAPVKKLQGPAGEIVRSAGKGSTVSGQHLTTREAALNGVRIPAEARVGIGDKLDRRRYDYVLHTSVFGPKGEPVAAMAHPRAARNGTDDPETGSVLVYCGGAGPGEYRVEVSLLVLVRDQNGVLQAELLDRADCTFTIRPAPR
jgi:hypothetical protein